METLEAEVMTTDDIKVGFALSRAMDRAVALKQVQDSTIPRLLLSALYKYSFDTEYDMALEAKLYEVYLAKYNIHSKREFPQHFLEVFSGKIIGHGITLPIPDKQDQMAPMSQYHQETIVEPRGVCLEVLTDCGHFKSESARSQIIELARSNGFGAAKSLDGNGLVIVNAPNMDASAVLEPLESPVHLVYSR